MITFEPDLTHYQKCTLLSRCFNNQGTVHMACHVPSGMMVVVKRLNLDKSKEAANLIQVTRLLLLLVLLGLFIFNMYISFYMKTNFLNLHEKYIRIL